MTTDFRALCAELADELHDFQWAVQEAGVGWACPDTESLIDRARAALAEPEPVGPPQPVPVLPEGTPIIEPPDHTLLVPIAQPIPVSERLPGPEDCDAEGFCWFFSPADPTAGPFGVAACWVLRKFEPEDDFRTHWLPAHTLPLPTTSRSN